MYFDPGTGSLVVQLFLAAIASIGALLVVFKNKIKSIFCFKGKKDE